ncbi:hypothetical protein DSM107003_13710 [Trichormus variabilis SAG 1403-4b]|uniref:Uncharacterized protein n=1 Tax=Trichormus variabilis SAG 1403-4b TaxID=447716 RepID=A0A433UWR4_ANAVA|nr:hypothetical protein DSM107003_13710 [Trichormus variabilis SAG 1403-4b]
MGGNFSQNGIRSGTGNLFTFNNSGFAGTTYSQISAPTAVPFDIPGGATIPTVGSLFALALMRKAKKSIASKNRIANPVNTVVS